MKKIISYIEFLLFIISIAFSAIFMLLNQFDKNSFKISNIVVLMITIIIVIIVTIKEALYLNNDTRARSIIVFSAFEAFFTACNYYLVKVLDNYEKYIYLYLFAFVFEILISIVFYKFFINKFKKDDKPHFKVNNNRK